MRAVTAKGFTLFELLVVLALVALIAAGSLPLLARGTGPAALKGAAQDVAAALRRARSEAVVRNTDVVLTVDVGERSFRVGDAAARALPATLAVELYTAQTERIAADAGGIRFFPDGSATGGEIVLADDRSKLNVQVDWLTGRVVIVDAATR
ncbi:MAG: GspH/FimT family pseudopilin [Rhodospirillales bacterium]